MPSRVSSVMPFRALQQMTDVDMHALYLHLHALPLVPDGER